MLYTRKNSSRWCNIVCWTTPKQCCYQGSTTLVELTMLMSIVRSIVARCWQRTIIVTMLLEQELTIVDGKSSLMVVNNDWTMIAEREQLWTIVVDNSCWQGAAQQCWQGAAHCSKLLTTFVKLFIFARVCLSFTLKDSLYNFNIIHKFQYENVLMHEHGCIRPKYNLHVCRKFFLYFLAGRKFLFPTLLMTSLLHVFKILVAICNKPV